MTKSVFQSGLCTINLTLDFADGVPSSPLLHRGVLLLPGGHDVREPGGVLRTGQTPSHLRPVHRQPGVRRRGLRPLWPGQPSGRQRR